MKILNVKYLFFSVLLMFHLVLLDCDEKSFLAEAADGAHSFPVQPGILVQGAFNRCEGIAFNGEGDLFVSGDRALWSVSVQGQVAQIADAHSNLGLAPIGDRDILFADFGPTNAWGHGHNRDGVVWRVTPGGTKTEAATGMGDPNFVLVLGDGSFLVSDDATDEIFIAHEEKSVDIFTQQINHPNGMALSADGTRLYVAQMFKRINPDMTDGRIWALSLANGAIQGPPEVIADLGDSAANDGLALDVEGRLYVAAWGTGEIWRIDPQTDDRVLIAGNMPGIASLAFGRGAFDHHAIYATSTRLGTIWKVDVGVEGLVLNR